ncbi:MAG: hypothetical protein IJ099_05910 [Alphaproteobacteria bacterium]|nr:hypothetical protein [Alphaproteobacteria bacterium]
MSSFIQFIKLFILGTTLQGIKFRTVLSIILTFSVLIIEVVIYYIYWDSIPNMVKYDYDFSDIPHNICEKKWIWYNVLLQIYICVFVFVIKYFSYKIKRIHNIVYDENNNLIPIINKRFSMLAWETAMLFVTTEQGYIFALIDIIENRMCDDIVTIIFLFWQTVLLIEFRSDLKVLKNKSINSEPNKDKKRA